MMTIKDESNISNLLEQIDILTKSYIEVGFLSGESSEILMIATVNEYGWEINVTPAMRGFLHFRGLHVGTTVKIPERSFIRASYDSNRKRIENMLEALYVQVTEDKITAKQALNQIGTNIVGMVKEFMTSVRSPANHPYTIEKKGSSNPLIATGTLRDRITYRIVRG